MFFKAECSTPSPPANSPSELELRRELNDSRRIRGDDLPEARARDVAVDSRGAHELRMVENVECLKAQV